MAKYQKYAEYKNSGVDWLGNIPSHWEIVPVGRLFIRLKRTGFPDQELLSVYRDYGVIPKSSRDDNNNKPSDDLGQYQLVNPNDLVMNKMKAWQGSIAISEYEGIVSPAYFVYQPLRSLFKRALPKYVHYLLRNPRYIAQYLRQSKGIRVNQWDLDPEEFQRIELVLPPKSEQNQIFKFLDYETSKIDSLIEKQQQLIELLKEKRQAVISHVVTKGLNPDVAMKDSGVEWLGQVPEHWMVSRLKYIKSKESNAFVDGPFGSNLKSEHFIENGDVYVIESNFATTGYLDPQMLKTISFSHFATIERSECRENDIIIAKIGARYGSSAILPKLEKRAVVSGNSLKLTVDTTNCDINYALNLLRHLKNEGAMDDGVNGSAQPALSLGGLNNIGFLTPPIEEQKEITKFIYNKLLSFNGLIEKAAFAIQLMQERRTALISAAVTGKIDVRNWHNPNNNNEAKTEFSA